VDTVLVDQWSEDAAVEEVAAEVTLQEVALPEAVEELEAWSPVEVEVLEVGTEPGGFGYPCDSPDSCNSGFCIDTPEGKECTITCMDECPEAFECALHEPSLPDQIYICAPAHLILCKPCTLNVDCLTGGADVGAVCAAYGEGGNFCATPCSGADDCPEPYDCVQTADVTGNEVEVCLHQEEPGCGDCNQLFADEGAWTTCYVENQWGSCDGERQCTAQGLTDCDAPEPAMEECNGIDDDCDGEADEQTGGGECFLSNDFGVCKGVYSCKDGMQACEGADPQPEACDGQDNNCNGQTDEDFPDLDEDGVADCMETDKDGDGVEDYQDNCPYDHNPSQDDFDLDTAGDVCDPDDDNDMVADEDDCQPYVSAVFPGAVEQCNGVDDNCNILVDEGFNDNDNDGLKDCADTDDDNDGFVDDLDCAPLDPSVHPEAAELCDGEDNNCDDDVDEGFPDTDGDGDPDCLDDDVDQDGVDNDDDNCPVDANSNQEDQDLDGQGDACDGDVDGDGIGNALDNCPGLFNPMQGDGDGDGAGDACDADADGDGVDDSADNCVGVKNPGQEDLDDDGLGDVCDDDDDGDNVPDASDNCPMTPNPAQEDSDFDGKGDACEDDIDGDFIPDTADNCVGVKNPGQEDLDQDGVGDACDDDDDGDSVPDSLDNCAGVENTGQEDLDQDGLGDVCDTDIDGDGIANGLDNCVEQFNPPQFDLDGDGEGDVCDSDADGDGVDDSEDNCVGVKNGQEDLDDDGLGDACDDDIDGDGDLNLKDCEPHDPAIHKGADELCDGIDNNCNNLVDEGFNDNDSDGLKDCVDADDDNDGDPDDTDCASLDPDIHVGAGEKCNGLDDDCNGAVDEGLGLLACGLGECEHSVEACADGQLQFCNPYEGAGPEECDGLDNNCDGEIDEGFPDLDGDGVLDCLDLDDDGDGTEDALDNCPALANEGQENFDGDEMGDACDPDDDDDGEPDLLDCEPLNGGVSHLATEACNGFDDDCDGLVDEAGALACVNYYLDLDEDGFGALGGGEKCLCEADDLYTALEAGDCEPLNADVYPGAEEVCNGLDDNCDGEVDEGADDFDEDGIADCVDPDVDGDDVVDVVDNCLLLANPGQENLDGDDLGDACDPDKDGDGVEPPADCDDEDGEIYPGQEDVLDGIDNDCDDQIDEDFHPTSCKTLLEAAPGTASGTYSLDPDSNGPVEAFQAYCDMETAGGGWTLAGKFSNADAKQWIDAKSRWTGSETLGDASTLAADVDAKSKAWSTVTAAEFMFTDTDDPGKYMMTTDNCVGGGTLSAFFTTHLAAYPQVGNYQKKCSISKTYAQSPHWMAEPDWNGQHQGSGDLGPNQGYILFGNSDPGPDTGAVISGYATTITEADCGLGVDEELNGGGGCSDGFCTTGHAQDLGGPTSCGYDDAQCQSEYPETVYLWIR